MRFLFLPFFLLVLTEGVSAATEVEMEACKYTPEIKKELKLTPAQEPRVEKVFLDLAPLRKQIEDAQQERGRLRRRGVSPETIEAQTRIVVALEDRCRERGHELLKPILNEEQLRRVLEMEEVHRQKARERRDAAAPSPPAAQP